MGASHDLRSRQIVSLDAPTPRASATDKVRNALRPLPETRIAGRILRRGMGLQADCRKLTRATGLQLVKCESNAPPAVKMLHRKQSLV